MVIRRRASTNNRSGGGAVLCWQSEAFCELIVRPVARQGESQRRTAAVACRPLVYSHRLITAAEPELSGRQVETKHSSFDKFGSN